MGKTKDLRAIIYAVLTTCQNAPVFYKQARDNPPNDFVVFSVDEVTRSDGRITCETEINVVGRGNDTASVEDRADAIQTALDKYVKIDNGVGVYFYAEGRHDVDEEDRTIIRRRLTFATYVYERT